MTKFLKKILLFVIVFFIIDKVFFIFLLISPKQEKDKRLEHLINGKINKEIVILGSSKGARNIIAKQIKDSLDLSCYNLSYPGSDIEFHKFLLQALLTFNENPKIIILAIDEPSELLPSKLINFRLDRLYPLAKYNYINNEMIKRNEKNFLSHFLVLSRINKRNFNLRKKHFSKLDTIKIYGSMPIPFQRKNTKFNYNNSSPSYSIEQELPKKVESFLKFQELCIINNIKLYLVFPPSYHAHNYLFEKRIKELAKPKVSIYVYDTLNTLYRDKSYFYDKEHLKTNGATIFTNEIINELKKSIETQTHNGIYDIKNET